MKMKEKTIRGGGAGVSLLLNILKGSVMALCASLLLVLMFAFILKFTNISENVILPVNQVIKGVSVFLGVFIGLKKHKEQGLLSGLLIGIVYTVLAFFIFALLAGNWVFDLSLLTDLAFGGIIGGVCGIICVNLKKSNN